MISKLTYIILFFFTIFTHAQTLTGKVVDAKTNAPLEAASVYFDNTTIGTITDENGAFSINFNDAVQSTLVISILGYEKAFVADYRSKQNITIQLKEAVAALDAVIINADDGMSRQLKMYKFKKEFLGISENGRSCKILNENDIKLRYNKKRNTITAWSNTPVIVKNKNLQYQISFDIIDFEIQLGQWNTVSVIYTGTSFYKDLDEKKKNKTRRKREKTYNGSIQHFMRALYNNDFKAQGYIFGKKGFVVKAEDFFTISKTEENGYKTVKLLDRLDIFYNTVVESVIQVTSNVFFVDKYGNYEPIPNVLFGGNMGYQRLGDALPLDYGLEN